MPFARLPVARFVQAALFLMPALFVATPADAQTLPSGATQWGVGGGVAALRKPYRGYDSETAVLPLVSYESEHFSLQVPQVDYKFSPVGPVIFRLRARYAFNDGYDSGDSAAFAGMADRDASLWLGGAAIWQNDIVNMSAELLGATGQSKGSRFAISLDRSFRYGAFVLTPRVTAVFLDRKYVDYYYGVRSAEITAGRPGYNGRSTTNIEAGLRLGYGLTPRQTVFVDVSGTSLGSAIKESPLVERSNQGAVRVGYLYRF